MGRKQSYPVLAMLLCILTACAVFLLICFTAAALSIGDPSTEHYAAASAIISFVAWRLVGFPYVETEPSRRRAGKSFAP